MQKMDHRSLLVRYIRHVTECEGTNYICRIGERNTSLPIAEEEVAEQRRLKKKATGWPDRSRSDEGFLPTQTTVTRCNAF